MSAATMTAESPTKATLDRLAGVNLSVLGPSNEAEPWLACARACGFELPPQVLALVDTAARLAAEHAAWTPPPPHKDADAMALLAGATVAEILAADDEAARLKSRFDRASRLLIAADGSLETICRDTFAPIRGQLIAGPLREAVASVLENARQLAAKLERFHPGYPAGLLEEASTKEIDAWRASRKLQSDLEKLQAAWLVSFRKAVDRDFKADRPGGFFAFLDPEVVTPEALRLGYDVEVLRIAAAPSEYRLLAPSELMPLIDSIDADLRAQTGPKGQVDFNGRTRVRRGMTSE